MKSLNQRKIFSKPLVGTMLLVSLFLIGGVIYIYSLNGNIFGWPHRMQTSTSPINTTPPSNDQISAGNSAKQNTIDNPRSSDMSKLSAGSDQPPAPTPQPNGKSSVDIHFTSISQTNSSLQIRTIVYSIQSVGTCTLSLTKSGATTVTRTSDIQALPSSSTCRGFDIPLSLLASGQWLANLSFSNDYTTGSTSQTVKIN